ncbi:MAG: hypothetical protein ABII90_11825 [Bacteroidota bacterium]
MTILNIVKTILGFVFDFECLNIKKDAQPTKCDKLHRYVVGQDARPTTFQPVSEKTEICPYCQGKNIIKKGTRKKKLETVQLYYCNDCQKVFTPQKVKGKQFPLKVILDGLNFYNTGFTLEESCGFLKEKFGLEVGINTLSNWVKEYEPLCRYARMRDFGLFHMKCAWFDETLRRGFISV